MGRLTAFAALTTVAFLATTGSALAADAGVSLGNDKQITPESVAVNRGDTVTWTWVGPDVDHSILSDAGQAETWDSDPSALGPTRPLNGTFPHTFSQLGTFSYHCRVHPVEMRGTVTVTNANPVASFTGPERITAGNAARFDAGGSTDVDGAIVSYEWDLDGDGTFETPTGTSSDVSRSYPDVGARLISVRVTDSDGATDSKSRFLSVDPPPPPVPQGPAPAPVTPPAATQTAGSGGTGSTRLTVTGSTRQRAVEARGVKVGASCPGRCTLRARGTIAIRGARGIRLAEARRTLTAAGRATLTLKVARRDLGRLRRALAKRTRVVTITVTARDATGAVRTGTRRVTLTR